MVLEWSQLGCCYCLEVTFSLLLPTNFFLITEVSHSSLLGAFGLLPGVVQDFSWICATAVPRGLYVVLSVEPGSAECKASALTHVLSLQPQTFFFLSFFRGSGCLCNSAENCSLLIAVLLHEHLCPHVDCDLLTLG